MTEHIARSACDPTGGQAATLVPLARGLPAAAYPWIRKLGRMLEKSASL